ncbi:MAG: riboflavin synthase [Gammaproteobacteria bacterium]|nr:riboflavin synthase [Gammaproteobacteria bacterium]
MFTGLVQGIGKICAKEERGGDLRFAVDATGLGAIEFANGESIAVNGVCLTATDVRGAVFSADVSNETRSKTTLGGMAPGDMVNLERSLVLGQALGGHLVAGHVDAIGEVREIEDDGRSWRMQVAVPPELDRLIAVKGSICVDGVSLTVNETGTGLFGVNIVPHTMQVTALGSISRGTRVNIEVDIIARYLERLLSGDAGEANTEGGRISADLLERLGFGKGQE